MNTCCLCDRTIEPTDKCRRLFDMYVCPECSEKLTTRLMERLICENAIMSFENKNCGGVNCECSDR